VIDLSVRIRTPRGLKSHTWGFECHGAANRNEKLERLPPSPTGCLERKCKRIASRDANRGKSLHVCLLVPQFEPIVEGRHSLECAIAEGYHFAERSSAAIVEEVPPAKSAVVDCAEFDRRSYSRRVVVL
jgi:hypothetical protein